MAPLSVPPELEHAVLATRRHHCAIGAPVHRKNLIGVAWQIQLQLPRPHIPHLITSLMVRC